VKLGALSAGTRVRGYLMTPYSSANTPGSKTHAMSTTTERPVQHRDDRFAATMNQVVRRLPWGISRIVPPSLLGFALINGFTFGVDLALLGVLHSWAGLPLWLSITVAYACAFGLSYLLNRILNFRSHGAVGPQVAVYVVVVIINYVVWILGVGTGLAALGLDYRLARVAAGACEAVYMYCAMRWIVFRRR
jgi:putative flippase GtrA